MRHLQRRPRKFPFKHESQLTPKTDKYKIKSTYIFGQQIFLEYKCHIPCLSLNLSGWSVYSLLFVMCVLCDHWHWHWHMHKKSAAETCTGFNCFHCNKKKLTERVPLYRYSHLQMKIKDIYHKVHKMGAIHKKFLSPGRQLDLFLKHSHQDKFSWTVTLLFIWVNEFVSSLEHFLFWETKDTV